MFPTPEKVATPGLSAANAKLQQTSAQLCQKLQDGQDCSEEVMGYCVSGGPATSSLLWASLGNRLDNKKGCPMSCLILLTMKADPDTQHPQIGPALCWAARNGNKEIVEKLIDAGADMEARDPDDSPALKAAIIAGAAGVAIELIRKGADVNWKHHDGATYLHIVTSWLCDGMAAGMNKRMPPVGDEPSKLVDMLIHHGVDPNGKQKWEGKGLSATETWRARKDESPWLHDERTFRDFEKAAKDIHKTLVYTSDALEAKVDANSAMKDKRFKDALDGYEAARAKLDKASMGTDEPTENQDKPTAKRKTANQGHHMASLWSNEALCHMKKEDMQRARDCCQEGLKLFCNDDLKTKLEFNLKKCCDAIAGAEFLEAQPCPETKPAAEKAAQTPKEEPERPKATRSKLEKGFLDNAKDGLYGPEGSKQGLMPQFYKQPVNGGEAVIDVPINQANCAKMKLIPWEPPPPKEDDDD